MDDRDFLTAFGERLRSERARRGMSRKLLAQHAGISERYITQAEAGKGNVSILILRQIAAALGIPVTRLLEAGESSDLARIRSLLATLSPEQLREAHASLSSTFATDPATTRHQRIALIGLRGAGKTTLGRMLAAERGVPFIELDREIERRSGTSLGSILELYGQQAYRRHELDALRELLDGQPQFVVATGGGIVSETTTYELLLRHCFTVWVRATPEEHMARVIAQGDHRPMAGSSQAMEDLRRILEERTPLYARADAEVVTSGRDADSTLRDLRAKISSRGDAE